MLGEHSVFPGPKIMGFSFFLTEYFRNTVQKTENEKNVSEKRKELLIQ